MAIKTTNKPITKIENGEIASRIEDVVGVAVRERNDRCVRDATETREETRRDDGRDEARFRAPRDETRDDDRE